MLMPVKSALDGLHLVVCSAAWIHWVWPSAEAATTSPELYTCTGLRVASDPCLSSRPTSLSHFTAQVIRIQPNEAIYLKINNKVPGLGLNLDVTKLDLTYKSRYDQHLPDAYERLILDVVNGDKRLFIRDDELYAAWSLFTPILKVGCLHTLCDMHTSWHSHTCTLCLVQEHQHATSATAHLRVICSPLLSGNG